jgi:hypothetical protein
MWRNASSCRIARPLVQLRITAPVFPHRSSMVFRGQDAWRQNPAFQGLWKQAFPGFKYAVIAFGAYVTFEAVYDFATKPRAKPVPAAKKPAGGCQTHAAPFSQYHSCLAYFIVEFLLRSCSNLAHAALCAPCLNDIDVPSVFSQNLCFCLLH